MPVFMLEEQLQSIKNHARSAYPEECCGFLLGSDSEVRRVQRVISTSNVNKESRTNRYNIDPLEIVRVDEEARRSNIKMIGIYHSHPEAPAQPSQFDLEHAWPWYTYLILSVHNGEPQDVAAWYLDEDRTTFHSDELKVKGGLDKW